MPRRRNLFILVCLLLGSLAASVTAAPRDQPLPLAGLVAALRNDAELLDLHFIDHQQGWAVGRQGAIWHTADGGRVWHPQESQVECSLNSVFFLDAHTGWAAGGYTHPYTHATTGVLLRTNDGGRTWARWQRAPLPALLKVKFLDVKQGWAIGQPSALFPHGVFFTDDSGRTWTPVSISGVQTWLCGDFNNPLQGCVAGQNGVLAALRDRNVVPSQTQFYGLRSPRQLIMKDARVGYAVGDGGLALATQDAGEHWQSLTEALPVVDVDFSAVAVHGSHIWIAGRPGDAVYYSPDAGVRWEIQSTGQTLPIRALHFVSEHRGWAAGAMGTILTTADGGRSWQRQRNTGRRAALLGIFADADQVPMEMFARLSAGEGYLSAVSIIGRRDLDAPLLKHEIPDRRIDEALTKCGVGAVDQAWAFPLYQRGLKIPAVRIVRRWAAMNQQPAGDLLEQHLVRQIQTWRPDVVVTVAASPRGKNPVDQLLNQSVLRAVRRAAEQPEASHQRRLAPWHVSKVYAVLPPRTVGTTSITTSQLIPSLGRSLADYVATPRSLLQKEYHAPELTLRFQLLMDQLPQGQGRRDFFSGLTIQPGSEARRQQAPAQDVELRQLQRAANRRQVVHAIVAAAGRDQQASKAWLGQVDQVIRDLDQTAAGELLFHLGSRYHHEGHWSLAADTFELLFEKYPRHPLAGASAQWLVQYYASGEAVARIDRTEAPAIRQATAELPADRPFFVAAPEAAGDGSKTNLNAQRLAVARDWSKRLQAADIMLHAEPTIQFPLAAALRTAGKLRQAERAYLGIQRSAAPNSWRYCAEAESALLKRDSQRLPATAAVKPTWICRRVQEKPLLDGKLDEAFWVAHRPTTDGAIPGGYIPLQSVYRDDESWPAEVRVGYDTDYLYFGILCGKPAGVDYVADDKPRTRDADLGDHDRVEILIDIDRDFATYYRLTIDHRGWTRESCWNDNSWNPDWYVASQQTESTWTCEIAIPLAQLSKRSDKQRLWAVGVQRSVPGVGFQSWTQPASTTVAPHGFGYLQFE